MARVQARFSRIPEAAIRAFNPPPIPGLGVTGGFDFELEDRGNASVRDLAAHCGCSADVPETDA